MGDFLKSVFDAWDERIRSPILGSIVFSYIAFNWQALFYLFFADAPVAVRLRFFDLNTNVTSLIYFPLGLGLFIAFAAPWLKVAGAWVAKFPNLRLSKLQAQEASEKRINELNLQAKILIAEAKRDAAQQEAIAGVEAAKEEAIAKVNAAREEAKLEAAERLKRAEQIGDEAKDDLVSTRLLPPDLQLSDDTEQPIWDDLEQIIRRMPKLDQSVVRFLGDYNTVAGNTDSDWFSWLVEAERDKIIQLFSDALSTSVDSQRAKVEFESAIPRLLDLKLLKQSSSLSGGPGQRRRHYLEFSSKGYAVLDALRNIEQNP